MLHDRADCNPSVHPRHVPIFEWPFSERKLLSAYAVSEYRSKYRAHVCTQLQGPGQLSRYSDLLQAGRFGDRIPVGDRFSAPVQTCPVTYPASYTLGTGSFPGVKRPGRGIDHPPHLLQRLKGKGKGRFMGPFKTAAIRPIVFLPPTSSRIHLQAPRIIQMRGTSTSEGGNYYQ